MKNQACSVYERLSKKTFLALLGNKPFKKEKPEIYGNTDLYTEKGITKAIPSDEAYSSNKTRAYFEKLNESGVAWSIVSFDPKTRKVCVEVKTKSGISNLSIVLPSIVSKEV